MLRPPAAVPHPDDPPAVWRSFATASAADRRARAALLAALPPRSDAVLEAALPVLLFRARGGARLEVLRAAHALARERALGPGAVYILVGELLGTSSAARAPSAAVLRSVPSQRAVALAVSAAARVPTVRGGEAGERAALEEWVRAGGDDALAGEDASALWRRWLDARDLEALPPELDHALVLCTAGAPRAIVEQLRKVSEHVVEARGHASDGAAALYAWLARECERAEELPASVRNPAWRATAARALALTAIQSAGHAATLRHLAATLHEGPLERAVTLCALRATVLAARRGPGAAPAALDDTLPELLAALDATTSMNPDYARIVAVLLGRDDAPARGARATVGAALLGAGRWLTDDVRARVHTVALRNPQLGARAVCLADLEAHGVPPVVLPALREVARSDPDPVTRQHARQLARGERL